MLTNEQAKTYFDMACERAAEGIVRDGSLISAFLIFPHGDGEAAIIAAPWASDDEREKVIEVLRIACAAHDAAAVCWINEAWQLSLAPGEQCTVRPKDSERRREVVVVQLAAQSPDDGDLRHWLSSREILRDADGKVTGLAPDPWRNGDEPTETRGLIDDILTRHRVPADLRKVAKYVFDTKLGERLVRQPDPGKH